MNLKQGTVYLIASWMVFSLSGFILNFWLGRTLGPVNYGFYGLVMSVLTWIEIIIINGVPYAVPKFIASSRQDSDAILRVSLEMQFLLSVILFVLSYFLAPFIAALFHQSALTVLFRIAFVDILFYGFYHLLASYQNGLGQFKKQSFLICIYSISKLFFVVLLVSWQRSLAGAFWANVGGSVCGLWAGLLMIRVKKVSRFSWKALSRFALPALGYFLLFSLLFYIDLWFVKSSLDDKTCGYYVAASTISKIPYYIFLGLSATLLPGIASYFSSGQFKKTTQIIQSGIRFFFIVAIPLAIMVTNLGTKLIMLFYSSEFASSGAILSILIWAMTLLALLALLTTALNAINKPHASMYIAFVTVMIDIFLNKMLIPKQGALGAAWAAVFSIMIGVITNYFVLKRHVNQLIDFRSALRILGASVVMIVILFLISDLNVFVVIVLAGLTYLIALVLFREIHINEIRQLWIQIKGEEN